MIFTGASSCFPAREAHYRALALVKADKWRSESLFEASVLFLQMSKEMVDREMAEMFERAA